MNGFSDYYTGAEYKPVRRYVAKRIVKAALVSAAFEAVFLGIGFFWSSHTGFGAGWLAIPLMGIIGLSGVKISGLLSLLTDRPCEGRIIESGTHRALMERKDGAYRRLRELQQ